MIYVKVVKFECDKFEICFLCVMGYWVELLEDCLIVEFNEDLILELILEFVGLFVIYNVGIIGEFVDFNFIYIGDLWYFILFFNFI